MKVKNQLPFMRQCTLCMVPEVRTIIDGKTYSNMYNNAFCKDCFIDMLTPKRDDEVKKT